MRSSAALTNTRPEPVPDHPSVKYRVYLGAAIRRARLRCGLSLKELAAELARDERQIARWESGDERALWDVLFAVDAYRPELIIALAELSHDRIDIDTVITVRRGNGGGR